MRLILSSRKPWNADYCDEASQVLFKAEVTGQSFGRQDIKVSNIIPPRAAEKEEAAQLKPIGQVEFHAFTTSHIKYQDGDHAVNKIFRKAGIGIYGRNRVFTGPDAKEYFWKMTPNVCKLFSNDQSKTPVATFHRKHWGIFSPKRPASLENFPPGEHMVELILITFIYIEKLREGREWAYIIMSTH